MFWFGFIGIKGRMIAKLFYNGWSPQDIGTLFCLSKSHIYGVVRKEKYLLIHREKELHKRIVPSIAEIGGQFLEWNCLSQEQEIAISYNEVIA